MNPRPKQASGIKAVMSFGQTSYAGSAIVGFVIGNLIFLLIYMFDAGRAARPSGYADQLPTLAACVAGSVLAMVVMAAVLNYVVGKQIMEGLALQREIYAQDDLPLLPRTDPTPYDLGVREPPERQNQPETEAA